MRQWLFRGMGLSILLTCLSPSAIPAQDGDDAEATRRRIAELMQALKQTERDFDEATAKRRAEWDLKLKKLEREDAEAFGKRHAEFTQKIKALQQREQSFHRKADAKAKGFFAKVEIRGRLEKRYHPETPSPFFPVEQITWWEVNVGDVRYQLDFKKNASLLKLAESNQRKIVLVTAVALTNERLEVQSLEAAKE